MSTATVAPAKTSLIPLSQIDLPVDARPHDPDALGILAHDMGIQGQLQEIIVEAKGRRYSVIAGVGRTLAARKLGWKEIRASVREGVSAFDRARITFAENEDREDADPFYQASLLQRMLDVKRVTQQALAKDLGISAPLVSAYMTINTLPRIIQTKFRRLNLGQLTQIARLNSISSKIEYAEECAKKDLSVRQLKALVSRALKKPTVSKAHKPASIELPDPLAKLWEPIRFKVQAPVWWEHHYGVHQGPAGKMNGWFFFASPTFGESQAELAKWFTQMGQALDVNAKRSTHRQDELPEYANEMHKMNSQPMGALGPIRLPKNSVEEKELKTIAASGTPRDVYTWIYGNNPVMLTVVPATWEEMGMAPKEGLEQILESIREFQKI